MSGRRRRSESLWDRKETENETKEFNSSGDSPKRSISEIHDVLMSDDFSTQGNENLLMDNDNISDKHRMKTDPAFDDWEGQYGQPYSGGKDRDRSRSRSWSPHRIRDRDQDRPRARDFDRGRTQGLERSPSRGGASRLDNDSTKNNRPEYSGGPQYHKTHKSGFNDQDHRRQSNHDIKIPCKYFIMGRCNRNNNCRYSHNEGRSHDHNDFTNPNPNFDDKNKSWKDPQLNNLESGFDDNQESRFIPIYSDFNLNGNGTNHQPNGSINKDGKPLVTSIPQGSSLPQISQNLNLANAIGLLYSGGMVDSTVVNEPLKVSDQKSTEPVGNVEVNENKVAEKSNMNLGKTEAEGKVDEGNMGNDEKAMRAFKIALVDFVKEILKPTWKEGKMSRDVYKTIVKKVVEKVTGTIQGSQIPRTQEKMDQYLTFSKAKISKLVEAYVGRLGKA